MFVNLKLKVFSNLAVEILKLYTLSVLPLSIIGTPSMSPSLLDIFSTVVLKLDILYCPDTEDKISIGVVKTVSNAATKSLIPNIGL